MTTPEPTDPNITYKVLRLTTEGYTEVDNINAVKLTKAQCDQVIQNLIADGVNPVSYTHLTLPTSDLV